MGENGERKQKVQIEVEKKNGKNYKAKGKWSEKGEYIVELMKGKWIEKWIKKVE